MPPDFGRLVEAHADGYATNEQTAVLEQHRAAWEAALLRMLDDAERSLENARQTIRGPEKAMVVEDFDDEVSKIDDLLQEIFGADQRRRNARPDEREKAPAVPAVCQLQLSWMPGRIVAWSAGNGVPPEESAQVLERLTAAGVSTTGWEDFQIVKPPGGGKAQTVAIPLYQVLGWLVGLGSTADDDTIGPSVTWLGLVTAFAVKLVAQGRMVPQLRRGRGRDKDGGDAIGKKGKASSFQVRWTPAVVDSKYLNELANSLPGSVAAVNNRQDPLAFTNTVLADIVHTICRMAAERIEVPAPPPRPNNRMEVGEALVARLDGSTFDAPGQIGSDLMRRLTQWGQPIVGAQKFQLVMDLAPPDDIGAWHLRVLAPAEGGALEPVETSMVNASKARRKDVKEELSRLERLYPELMRGGGARRAEVILSQDEAWQLMTVTGRMLQAAGFEVRVPALSRRKPTPTLRLTSEESPDSVVGAQQLANVRWSAVFDDIELTAAEISALAAQARPLVQSRGQWIELDKADLAQAAAALADRADKTQLTGADMLRHALGIEGPALGGISIAGDGWAADLLRSAADIPEDLPTQPEGFEGTLRSYQADALAWLGFLNTAGLGGCLALDMGLGKTPTMLASIYQGREHGPALVIAPPAVVGNWAAEARKFVPDVKVAVHHGPRRAGPGEIPALTRKNDLVITTYGTAVRDVEALSKISWGKVVLDEAQAIKNPTSETAQQLRRIEARTRIALTGTPIENGLGDLWAIMDYVNPGLVGGRAPFISQLSPQNADRKEGAESALQALNGILVFRRTKAEPLIAAELPDRIDELDHCAMTTEQIGLYQAVLDDLVRSQELADSLGRNEKKGAVLAAITALKQICNHPVNYQDDGEGLEGRSGKLARLNEIIDRVFAADERMLIFTHFASWGEKLSEYLTERTGHRIECYHGGLARGARDRMVEQFQAGEGAGAMVLSLKAGGTGLNLTAANHVVLYDRWWNPAVEDQARDRVWRIGQKNTVICHRLICPGTVDERVEEVVAGKRQIADMVLPKSSSIGDLDASQLQRALGIDPSAVLSDDAEAEVLA